MRRTILPSYFGTIDPALRVERYDLRTQSGFCVSVMNYGATIVGIYAPDRNGRTQNLVLAYPTIQAYRKQPWYAGATIGRYANRIANGAFELDGVRYVLSTNEDGTTLHGGVRGFDRVMWEKVQSREVNGVCELQLRHVSPAGDQGFPGCLDATVRFVVGPQAQLEIHYRARTDAPTVVNLTNHSYFNLAGDPAQPIGSHRLAVNASHYTPLDEKKIPTGEIASVEGTRFDLRWPRPLARFDDNWVLDRDDAELAHAARLSDARSGRVLDLFTSEPGLQVFSGRGDFVALEPQHFPDSPHHVDFPSTVLRPDRTMTSVSSYVFTVDTTR